MTRPPALFSSTFRSSKPYICSRCLLNQKRAVSTSFLNKKYDAKDQWDKWAKEIRAGKRKSMLDILEERGFIHDIAGTRKDFETALIDKRAGAYCGVDPTAPSLHVGHMLPLMALFWMYLHGYHTVSVIGGATAKIGDPTGRTTDRQEMTTTERKANLASMHYQIKKLWVNVEKTGARHGYLWEKFWHRELVNNATWWNNLTFLDIMKFLGKGLRMGSMLAKDTVKTKLQSKEGMSFAEFCYPIFQSWDWYHMFQTKAINIQIGGQDQFGNITAGVEAVKYCAMNHPDPDIRFPLKKTEDKPYGFTVPLLTTASGAKFGKSAGNAIWLDSQMTSVFDLYGFFVGTADADVHRYLKLFTFLPLDTIQSIVDKHAEDPSKRVAQHALAFEFCELVHGEQQATNAQNQHRALFARGKGTSLKSLLEKADGQQQDSTEQRIRYEEATPVGKEAPPSLNPYHYNDNTEQRADFANPSINKFAKGTSAQNAGHMHTVLPKSLLYMQSIAKVLWSAGLVRSRSEGHRLAESQGAYIGRRPSDKETMSDQVEFFPAKLRDPALLWDNVIRDDDQGRMEKPGEEGLILLRTGKWKVKIVRIVSDDLYTQMLAKGEVAEAPGWREHLATQSAERAGSPVAREVLEKRIAAQRKHNQDGTAADPQRNHLALASDDDDFDAAAVRLPGEDPAQTPADEREADLEDHGWLEQSSKRPNTRARDAFRHEQHQCGWDVLKGQLAAQTERRANQAGLRDREEAASTAEDDGEGVARQRTTETQLGARSSRTRPSRDDAAGAPEQSRSPRDVLNRLERQMRSQPSAGLRDKEVEDARGVSWEDRQRGRQGKQNKKAWNQLKFGR